MFSSRLSSDPHANSSSSAKRRLRLGVCSALAGCALAVVAVAPAQAALVSTGACDEAPLSQPFLPWGDASSYELMQGGDFEGSLAGWTLAGKAERVAGSEPYAASGSLGSHSLSLPAGSSAQSPYTCVNASYPTFRLFARSEGAAAAVSVQVVYVTALGETALPLGVILAGESWQPTLPMLTGSVATGALSGGTAEAALRFTALSGTADVDDVFVDPRMH